MSGARSSAGARLILHRYRRMILLGQASLPLEAARSLVGPDCAYHLYFRHGRRRAARRQAATRTRRG